AKNPLKRVVFSASRQKFPPLSPYLAGNKKQWSVPVPSLEAGWRSPDVRFAPGGNPATDRAENDAHASSSPQQEGASPDLVRQTFLWERYSIPWKGRQVPLVRRFPRFWKKQVGKWGRY
ncbi:MAG TPA: hypothetical protein VFV38_53280, partial [Ktedonobacteraceae bacterium]|nr:hypothetical protein [Ktedonobacteraceae bacterium]